LSGYLYQQTGTLEIKELGGLLRKLPFIGTSLVIAAFAGCGLPGFANFVGEVTVLFGAWSVPALRLITVLACWGALIIGAIYMLRAVRNILHAELPAKWANITDAHLWRKLPYALLIVCLLVFGVFPRLLTEKLEGPVAAIVPAANSETPAKTETVRVETSQQNLLTSTSTK
jgi:NADH-quinone oxidoreductase subunit M